LDFLRALAIFFVLVAHGTGLLLPFVPWWFGFFSHGGFYGVELFFVLSGFLIGTILVRSGSELGKPDHVAAFYIRRRFRTPPLFWLFLGVHTMLEHFNTNGMIKFAVGTRERLGRAFHFPIG
jgi:peptidoglycan/LPS O-acetylase OafA/YrhL